MRVTIEKDNGETEVFQDITDLYIAYRITKRYGIETFPMVTTIQETRSHSWGANLRELVKEVTQSLVELQDFLREQRNGGTS